METRDLQLLAEQAYKNGEISKAVSILQSLVPMESEAKPIVSKLVEWIENDIVSEANPSARLKKCRHYWDTLQSTLTVLEVRKEYRGLDVLTRFLPELESASYALEGDGWDLISTDLFENLSAYYVINQRHGDLAELADQEPLEIGSKYWSVENQKHQETASGNNLPGILFVTLPKSGSIYIWNQIALALDMPEVRIAEPTFFNETAVPKWTRQLATGGAIAQQHLGPTEHNLKTISENGLKKIVVHTRDPRQSLLSMVHWIDHRAPWPEFPERPPREYLIWPVERKIDWALEYVFDAMVNWIENWHCAQQEDDRLDIHLTSYELFRRDPSAYFQDLADFYELPKDALNLAIEAAKSPPDSEGDMHFRKGKTDEWKDVFNEDQKHYCTSRMPSWWEDAQ